jgi:hypothetical protein
VCAGVGAGGAGAKIPFEIPIRPGRWHCGHAGAGDRAGRACWRAVTGAGVMGVAPRTGETSWGWCGRLGDNPADTRGGQASSHLPYADSLCALEGLPASHECSLGK